MSTIVTKPHPLVSNTNTDVVSKGLSVHEIVQMMCDKYNVSEWHRRNIYVEIDGTPIKDWDITPLSDQHVMIHCNVPKGGGGGGGKNPMRVILSIVVLIASIYTGGTVGAAYGSMYGAMAAAAVSIVGNLLISALVPVTPLGSSGLSYSTSSEESQVYSISGMQNNARPYGPLPSVLGRVRFAPYFGAGSYTQIKGDDQYLHSLFAWGYGPLSISDIKIGETGINEYQDIQVATNQGYETDSELALYPDDIYEETISSVLSHNSPVLRTSIADADGINIDVEFQRGLVTLDSQGNRTNRTIELLFEWRKLGTSEWAASSSRYIRSASSYYSNEKWKYDTITRSLLTYIDLEEHRISFTAFEVQGKSETYMNNSDRWVSRRYPADLPNVNNPAAYFPWLNNSRYHALNFAAFNINKSAAASFPIPEGFEGFEISSGFVSNYGYSISVGDGGLIGYKENETFKYIALSAASTQPVRRNITADIQSKGQYEVRVTRITPESSSLQIYDDVTWTILRNVKNQDPMNFPFPVAETQMVIRATDQLSGNVRTLNGVCTSVCKDYDVDTGQWVLRETNNPAALFRHVLQGTANAKPYPDSRIDLVALEEWAEFCNEQGFTYNKVHDAESGVLQVLSDICAAGRATPVILDNNWSVVIDRERVNGPVQLFTPANSWGFSSRKSFNGDLHGYRCQFNNEDEDFIEDEIFVYAEGYNESNASLIEALQFAGVTNATHIQKLARYHLAVRKYRPEVFTWQADFEHMICSRGDLVALSHHVIRVGFESGRIKSVDGDNVTLDQEVTLEPGKEYGLMMRLNPDSASPDKTLIGVRPVQGVSETVNTNTLTVNGTGIIPEAGSLYTFGILGKEHVEVIVTSKTPSDNMTATITGVQYSWPEIQAFLNGAYPDFNSNITTDAYDIRPAPPQPVITTVTSDESVMVKNDDGTFSSRLVALVRVPSGKIPVRSIQSQLSLDGITWTESPDTDPMTPISFSDVEDGADAILRVRTIGEGGLTSEWAVTDHKIVGKTTPPPDVGSISFDNDVISWEYPEQPIDFKGFRVKTSHFEFASWEAATEVPDGLVFDKRYVLPATFGTVAVMVKAVDVVGNESVNFASVVINAGDPIVENVVLTQTEEPAWSGMITGGSIVSGDLRPNDTSLAFQPINELAFQPINELAFESRSSAMSYVFRVNVLPEHVGAGLTLDVDATGRYTIEYQQITLDSSGLAFQPVNELAFQPVNELAFSDQLDKGWKPWGGRIETIQDISYYEFRVSFSGGLAIGEELLKGVTAVIDVPDINETLTDFNVPVNGAKLPVTKVFKGIKNVNLTLENADGDNAISVKLKDRDISGPFVVVYDGSGNSVTGVVSAVIQGY